MQFVPLHFDITFIPLSLKITNESVSFLQYVIGKNFYMLKKEKGDLAASFILQHVFTSHLELHV